MDDYMLQIRLFNSMTEKQLKLLGYCLANRMELMSEHQAGIIWLDKEDYKNGLLDVVIQKGLSIIFSW